MNYSFLGSRKLLSLAIAGALGSQLFLATPSYADNHKKPAEAKEEAPATTAAAEEEEEKESDISLSVQHTVKGAALPAQTIKLEPLVLLNQLKKDITEQLAKNGKPLTLETVVKLIDSDPKPEIVPPVLTVKTAIDNKGMGTSQLSVPEWKASFKDEDSGNPINLTWAGLSGMLNYDDKFSSPKVDLTIAPFSGKEDKGMIITLDKTTLKGELDADLIPQTLNVNLPLFHMSDEKEFDIKLASFVMDAALSKVAVDKLPEPLDITKAIVKLGEMAIASPSDEFSFNLQNLSFSGDGKVTGDVANYVLNTVIDKIKVSGAVEKDLEISYKDSWSFNRIDAAAMLELQKQTRELQKQMIEGKMNEDMLGMAMMGTLMQLLPKLWVKSPELAINDLLLTTQDGNLMAKASIGVDGAQPMKMDDAQKMAAAVIASANVEIDKSLLNEILAIKAREEVGLSDEMTEKEKTAAEKKVTDSVKKELDGLIKQKIFVAKGDKLMLEASMKNGKLVLNGADIPLPFDEKPAAKPKK